jgi:hypothetical protein
MTGSIGDVAERDHHVIERAEQIQTNPNTRIVPTHEDYELLYTEYVLPLIADHIPPRERLVEDNPLAVNTGLCDNEERTVFVVNDSADYTYRAGVEAFIGPWQNQVTVSVANAYVEKDGVLKPTGQNLGFSLSFGEGENREYFLVRHPDTLFEPVTPGESDSRYHNDNEQDIRVGYDEQVEKLETILRCIDPPDNKFDRGIDPDSQQEQTEELLGRYFDLFHQLKVLFDTNQFRYSLKDPEIEASKVILMQQPADADPKKVYAQSGPNQLMILDQGVLITVSTTELTNGEHTLFPALAMTFKRYSADQVANHVYTDIELNTPKDEVTLYVPSALTVEYLMHSGKFPLERDPGGSTARDGEICATLTQQENPGLTPEKLEFAEDFLRLGLHTSGCARFDQPELNNPLSVRQKLGGIALAS